MTPKEYTRHARAANATNRWNCSTPRRHGSNDVLLRQGLNNIPVNTMDYTFAAPSVAALDDGSQVVTMRLDVSDDAAVVYRYTLRNGESLAENYLVDFDVQLAGMTAQMANQTTVGIDWSNTSYQNERGFKNENMYATLSYRFPDESSIEELGMGDGTKSKERRRRSTGWHSNTVLLVGLHRHEEM